MAEVELMDQDKEPREFDEGIIMVGLNYFLKKKILIIYCK